MKKRSFTLLEILIAMGVVVILAAITIGVSTYAGSRSEEAVTLSKMKAFEMALEKYKSDHGMYPIQAAGEVNFSNDAWKKFRAGRYMDGELSGKFKDGYDNTFYYGFPGSKTKRSKNSGKYELWSMGADGKQGNGKAADKVDNAGDEDGDDICSWQQH